MRINSLILVVAVASFAIGCVAPPAKPMDWRTVKDEYLCSEVGKKRFTPHEHAQGVSELLRRKQIRQRYVGTIRSREVTVGMTECEVIAAWGWPTDTNESHYEWGVHNQMVYGSYTHGKMNYVFTRDRVVTSYTK